MIRLALALALMAAAPAAQVDTDGDGLGDFQETHKYLTDPRRADSDGDGVPDLDGRERREYTYTVRAVIDVLPPVNTEALHDDFQDARVLEQRADFVQLEVTLYPFNTCGDAIKPNPEWRRDPALPREYLRPGVTTNWDEPMRRSMIESLAADGIDIEELTDVETVQRVSKWLLERARFEDSFTTFAVDFAGGEPFVPQDMRPAVQRALDANGRTLEEQWNRELLGKGMYETRWRGTCTSSAIYLATGLKAIGIPTRTVVCVPVIDASDPCEVPLLERLTHHRVRRMLQRSTARLADSWASHTFNEVYVGGRWRRLNYDRIGQNILDEQALGLMVHVHTFDDHANAGLIAWGRRKQPRDVDVFEHSNPYSCVSISDWFGPHARFDNPPPQDEHRVLTITRVYWYDDPDKDEVVQMRLDDPQTAGHVVVHVAEGFEGQGVSQYQEFYEKVDKEFRLTAEGRDDVRLFAARGYWVDIARDVREFYLHIPPDQFEKMAAGVPYRLHVVADDEPFRWEIRGELTLTRPAERSESGG